MTLQRTIAIALIVIGVLGVAYGGFSYTKDVRRTDIGPLHISLKEKGYVNIPIWAGVGAILVGGFLILYRGKF